MKSPDESLSDSEKMKFMAMYEMMKNQPDFADLFSKTQQKQSDGAQSEPRETTRERRNTKLKATPLEEDLDHELDLKNDFIYEERCQCLANQSKFYESTSLLNEMKSIEENDIGTKLLTAECFIQLGRESKADRALKDVEKILTKPPMCDVNDVIALAEDLTSSKNYVQALILLRIVGSMFKNSDISPDDKLNGLHKCMKKMGNAVGKMLDPVDKSKVDNLEELLQNLQGLTSPLKALTSGETSDMNAAKKMDRGSNRVQINERIRVIAFDYGVAVMEEMLEDLKTFNVADKENLALKYAWTANMINNHYSKSSQHKKAVKALLSGIDILEKQFGRTASQHHIYIITLSNISTEMHNLERYVEAEKMVLRAIEGIDDVLDFDDDRERQSENKRLRDSLKITRNHLKLA